MDIQTTTIVEDNTGIVRPMTGLPTPVTVVMSQQERDKKEIERLRSKNGTYLSKEAHWKFLLRSYEGGPDYTATDTLFKHQRENQADFEDRLKRAHFQNYTQPLVDFVPEFIFNQPIDREPEGGLKPDFDEFEKDCDGCGTDLNDFMQARGEDSRIYGHTWVQVDKPARPVGVQLSKQQEAEGGYDKPYLVPVCPLEVFDWRSDTRGRIVYLKRQQLATVEAPGGNVVDVEIYYEWYRDRYLVSYIDVSDPKKPKLRRDMEVGSAHPWGLVPFVQVFNRRSKSNTDLGVSFLQDIAYQNRHVFNLTSLIDEFLFRQCFNFLAMQQDNVVPTVENVKGEIGSSNLLEYPKDGKAPEYVSPPVDPAEFIQKERDIAIREMYRQAAQDVAAELFGRSNGSGDAAKQAFGRTVPVLARAADMLQDAEVKIATLWAKMKGQEWKGKIAYKDNYDVTNFQDLLLQLTTIFNRIRILSPTFIREEWKRVIREFDGRLPVGTLDKIYAELDKMTDEELKELFVSANDEKDEAGMASTSSMLQGRSQKGSTDKKIALATGSRADTKEKVPDRKRSKAAQRSSPKT